MYSRFHQAEITAQAGGLKQKEICDGFADE